jgi:hypothetical protein
MERDGFDIIQMYYYPIDNVMLDERGYIIYDIFDYITPNVLAVFKETKHFRTTVTRWGDLVELIYIGTEDDY